MILTTQPSIEGVQFGNVDIHIKGKELPRSIWERDDRHSLIGHIDLGSISLENNGRKFILDVDSYYISPGLRHNVTHIINADISVNTSDFPVDDDEYTYDLTKDDLLDLNHGGRGTLYVTADGDAPSFEVLSIQLWFTADGPYQYVNLEQEK